MKELGETFAKKQPLKIKLILGYFKIKFPLRCNIKKKNLNYHFS